MAVLGAFGGREELTRRRQVCNVNLAIMEEIDELVSLEAMEIGMRKVYLARLAGILVEIEGILET